MNRIDKLEGKFEKQANPINELEGQIALQKNMADQLEIKCDNTADVLVFEFMESKYQRINLLIM